MDLWTYYLLRTFVEFARLLEIVVLGFFVSIFYEAFKRSRRWNLRCSNEAQSYFEDPNSFELVPRPSIFDPAQRYISLIIPAFNEEHRLPETLDEAMNYLQRRMAKDKSFTYEVLIVDDGSVDGTRKVAFDFVRKYSIDCVRVILLGRNHGKGEAIRTGMLHARGEFLLMLDADGATWINELEKLEYQILGVAEHTLHYGDAGPCDSSSRNSDVPVAVFGSRGCLQNKALATMKWHQNLLMKGFFHLVLMVVDSGIVDTQCGFKMFTRAAARKLFTNIHLKRWCVDVELVYLCRHLAIPMVEIPIRWYDIPGSKLNLSRSVLHMLWELVLMSVGYRCSIWKIHS